jgi:outer membrane protein assembly factor BamB
VIEVDGKPQLVSPAAFGTIAYDPRTGQEIWKVVHGGMNVAARPLYFQGRFLLCTGDGGLRLLSVRGDGTGDVTSTHMEWTTSKNVPSRSSPILVGDNLYMVHESGIVSQVDARTGRTVHQERLAGKFWASPLYAEERLYFLGEEGVGYVVDIHGGWKLLATNRLADGFMASPAVAGKSLILRTRSALYCVEQQK